MGLNRNQSTITQILVNCREIDRVYDIPFGCMLSGDRNHPEFLFDNEPATSVFWTGRAMPRRYTDDQGRDVSGRKQWLDGVYGGFRADAGLPFLRSFAGSRSKPIDRKFVYMWSSSDGATVDLEHELWFQNGKFWHIPFDTSEKGKDTRTPGGDPQDALLLDLLSFWDAKHAVETYYFLLTPYQLPWKTLEKIKPDVPARAIRLGDWLYTDTYSSTDVKAAEPPSFEMLAGTVPIPLMFQVHLVDAFKEAQTRSERFVSALHDWQKLHLDLHSNDQYTLALRVHRLAKNSRELAEDNLNEEALGNYIWHAEIDSTERLRLATFLCEDLLRWIGRETERCQSTFDDSSNAAALWFVKAGLIKGLMPNSEAMAKHNWFSQSVDDYDHGPPEICEEVAKIVFSVHNGLNELDFPGGVWLKRIFDGFMEGHAVLAHGGESLLFFGKRKGFLTAKGFAAGLLTFQAKNWVGRYPKDSLVTLRNWIKNIHDIDTELLDRTERKIVNRKYHQELLAARRDPHSLEFETNRIKSLKVLNKGFSFAVLAVEAVNCKVALHDWEEENNYFTRLAVVGAAVDLYESLSGVFRALEIEKVAIGGSKVLRFGPLGVISAVIDLTLITHDLATVATRDEGIAHGLRGVGAAMSLGGAMTVETGWGFGVLVLGLAFQWVGSVAAADLNAAKRFLRFCAWGQGPNLADRVTPDQQDEEWYKGKLSQLAANFKEQHRCLDNLIYNFWPEFWTERESSIMTGDYIQLYGKIPQAHWAQELGDFSVAEIQLTLSREDVSPIPAPLPPYPVIGPATPAAAPALAKHTLKFSNLTTEGNPGLYEMLKGEPFPIQSFICDRRIATDAWDLAEGKVIIDCVATVDVFGDGKTIITRKREESYNLWWRL